MNVPYERIGDNVGAVAPSHRPGVLATGHAKSVLWICIVFLPFSIASTLARVYCRRLKRVPLKIDDWLIIAATICLIGLSGHYLGTLFRGRIGTHIQYVTRGELKYSWQALVIGPMFYGVIVTLVRCSLCCLFLRIFQTRSYQLMCYGNIAFNISWGLYTVLIEPLRCDPPSASFNLDVHGTCLNPRVVWASVPSWGLLCDILTWTLPLPVLWRLNMPFRDRLGVSLVFCFGLINIAIEIIRIVVSLSFARDDYTYTVSTQMNWGYVDMATAVMIANTTAFAPLYKKSSAWVVRCEQRYLSWQRTLHSTSVSHIDDLSKEGTKKQLDYMLSSRPFSTETTIQGGSRNSQNLQQTGDVSLDGVIWVQHDIVVRNQSR